MCPREEGGCEWLTYDDLAVHPLAILRSEEGNNAGNIDGLADTVVGRPGSGVLINLVVGEVLAVGDVLLADSMVHVGLDTTWSNAVDSDLLVTSVNSHAAGEGLDSTLAAGVESVLGNALGLAGNGAHQDDAATLGHVLVGLAGDEELATGVDAHNAVVLLLSDILQVAERDNTGVGAADVELAIVLNNFVHELDGLGDVGNVGLDGNSVRANLVFDLRDDLLGSLRTVGIVDDNLGTAAGELKSHLLSDTTACDASG